MSEEINYCLICKSLLAFGSKIDVKSTTTQKSQVNLEDFIKESVLSLSGEIVFTTHYICKECQCSLNEFDSYNIKCKQIQAYLVEQFLSEQWLIREELLLVVDEADSNKNCKIEKFEKHVQEIKDAPINIKDPDANPEFYCCEICGEKFDEANKCRLHYEIHIDINNFQCDVCNKTFTQKIGLIRHMRKHTGEAPYECVKCKKKFIHHSSFNLHKMKHAGIRNYKCEICDLAFICKSHLLRHMRTHTSEKKYQCSDCGKMFAERYNLIAHQKKLHSKLDIGKDLVQTCEKT